MGKQIDAGQVAHRRVEITVEREVVSYLRSSAPGLAEGGEVCGHCGQPMPMPHELASAVLPEGAACAHLGLVEQADGTQLQDIRSQKSNSKDEVMG